MSFNIQHGKDLSIKLLIWFNGEYDKSVKQKSLV